MPTRLDISDLLPRHGHVLEQLQHCVRHVFERSQVDALVMSILLWGHVAVVPDDFSDVLWKVDNSSWFSPNLASTDFDFSGRFGGIKFTVWKEFAVKKVFHGFHFGLLVKAVHLSNLYDCIQEIEIKKSRLCVGLEIMSSMYRVFLEKVSLTYRAPTLISILLVFGFYKKPNFDIKFLKFDYFIFDFSAFLPGGISSFWVSTAPNLRFSAYRFDCSCRHFLAFSSKMCCWTEGAVWKILILNLIFYFLNPPSLPHPSAHNRCEETKQPFLKIKK